MKPARARMKRKVCASLLLSLAASSACTSHAPAPSNANAPAQLNANASAPSNANAAPKSPLAGIVRASAENVELRAGETAEATVLLAITSGYHVNANPATERFLIPTSLEVKPEAGITAERIVYPKPLTKRFAFAEVPLAVYEGDARITMTIRAPRDAAPGAHALAARLRVQPCDDEKCYPPATVETSIPVTIR
ncbi:MAG TPA: protein-disulfide reductase DsbD domain-containing protein [Pyrinomonadaceae bacterium]|jgi:DsbC/DsbD-like thiol-disulfide interchange protein